MAGNPGEERAWELLVACDPREVCARTLADYCAEEGVYILRVLGLPVAVDIKTRTIKESDPRSEFILTRAGYFSRLSILHYLVGGQNVAPSGRLLKPVELKVGQFFVKGSHVLPLEAIAARYSGDPAGFMAQAARFGGEPRAHGDAAVELRPFPCLPVTLIFRDADEEFPAGCDLLFDDTCELHLPPDLLWSTAMLCTKVMLQG